jgi:hypothetical protein
MSMKSADTLEASRLDLLRHELDALRAVASRVINEHVGDGTGMCQVCRSTFPCARACLAEHNLETCSTALLGEPRQRTSTTSSPRIRSK